MMQEGTVIRKKLRREPKPGTGFAVLRAFGIILLTGGALISSAAAVWLIVILVKTAPDFISGLPYTIEQQGAGFYLILVLLWWILPVITGFLGLLMLVAGIVFYRLATTRPGITSGN
jgi:hypothetical protein